MSTQISGPIVKLTILLLLLAASSAGGHVWGAYPKQAEMTVLQWKFSAVASEMKRIAGTYAARGIGADANILYAVSDSALLASERSAHFADLAAIAAETAEGHIREFCEQQMRSNALAQIFSEFAILNDISRAQRAAMLFKEERAGKLASELVDAFEQYKRLLMDTPIEDLADPQKKPGI